MGVEPKDCESVKDTEGLWCSLFLWKDNCLLIWCSKVTIQDAFISQVSQLLPCSKARKRLSSKTLGSLTSSGRSNHRMIRNDVLLFLFVEGDVNSILQDTGQTSKLQPMIDWTLVQSTSCGGSNAPHELSTNHESCFSWHGELIPFVLSQLLSLQELSHPKDPHIHCSFQQEGFAFVLLWQRWKANANGASEAPDSIISASHGKPWISLVDSLLMLHFKGYRHSLTATI